MSFLSVESQLKETNEVVDASISEPLEVKMVSVGSISGLIAQSITTFQLVLLNCHHHLGTGSEDKPGVFVLLFWQESVQLLGQFKEFMVTYNKVYSSQEGECLLRIVSAKQSELRKVFPSTPSTLYVLTAFSQQQ